MTDAVLVIRRGGLGDTLLMLPLLAALRREHPFAKLWFAGVLDFASVLFSHGAVDCAISSESLQLWSLGLDSVTGAQARARLSSFARILSDDLTVATALPSCRVQTYDPRPLRDDAPPLRSSPCNLGCRSLWLTRHCRHCRHCPMCTSVCRSCSRQAVVVRSSAGHLSASLRSWLRVFGSAGIACGGGWACRG